MKIFILVDNLNSWALPHAKRLVKKLKSNHEVYLVHDQNKIKNGDIAIFLSCEKIVNPNILKKNDHNLVPHASFLPKGKGWSPLTWQILEGKNNIPITLFEAGEKVDDGVIYDQKIINFEGHELLGEMQEVLGKKINKMIINFLVKYPDIKGIKQKGKESFYKRRYPKDSQLDINKNIIKQFNLFRIVNNEKYPAFFEYLGYTYTLKIEKKLIK